MLLPLKLCNPDLYSIGTIPHSAFLRNCGTIPVLSYEFSPLQIATASPLSNKIKCGRGSLSISYDLLLRFKTSGFRFTQLT